MAQTGRPTRTKRQKEAQRLARREKKEARRAERKEERRQRSDKVPPREQEADPDIAGVVPGPQPARF